MDTPKKVIVVKESEGPLFVYRWRDWGMIIALLIGLVFAIFPIWLGVSIVENPPTIFWIFLLLFSGIGLCLAYYGLGRIINRTEIRVQGGNLSVRQKPLPWRYQSSLPVGEIKEVKQETYFTRSRDSRPGHHQDNSRVPDDLS
jgi:hypothetical protein